MRRRALLAAGIAAFAAPAARAQGRFAAAAAYSAQRGGAALVIARHGIVLAEDYPSGAPDSRWRIGAGTRAFAPLLAASLIDDRLMNLDEPVAMTLGAWGADPQKSLITIRLLLSGASGVAFGRRRVGGAEEAIALEPAAGPGERFIDDPAPYLLLAEIARRKLEAAGRLPDAATYLTERTLAPIGCTPIGWTRGEDGAARFDTGAAVTARGWAQVGELIRREGVWRARVLADGATLREARRGVIAEPRAGMGLWLANGGRSAQGLNVESDLWRMSPPAPIDLAMAAGEGGQRLYIIPSANLVVARLARGLDAPGWSDAQFLALLSQDL